MASKVTTVLSLRDNYTAVIKKARSYTKAFEKDVNSMTDRLDKAGKKKLELSVKNNAAMMAISAVEKKIAPIRNVMVKIDANAAHFKNQIRPVESIFRKFTGKAWTVTWKVKDGVTAAVTKIGFALKKVGNVAGTIGNTVSSAGSYAIGRGMELNQCVADVPYNTGNVMKTSMGAMTLNNAQAGKLDGSVGQEKRERNTVLPSRERSMFASANVTSNTSIPSITTALQSRDMLQFAADTTHKAWENLSNTMQSANNILNTVSPGNNLAPADTSVQTGGTGSSSSGSSGEAPTENKKGDDLWATFGKIDLIRSALTLLYSGIKNRDKIWSGIKNVGTFLKNLGVDTGTVVSAGGAALASGASAILNSPGTFSLANGIGDFLAAGGSNFIPAAGVWFDNNKRVWASEYQQATGTYADENTLGGLNKILGWKLIDYIQFVGNNFNEWGKNFNTFMDQNVSAPLKESAVSGINDALFYLPPWDNNPADTLGYKLGLYPKYVKPESGTSNFTGNIFMDTVLSQNSGSSKSSPTVTATPNPTPTPGPIPNVPITTPAPPTSSSAVTNTQTALKPADPAVASSLGAVESEINGITGALGNASNALYGFYGALSSPPVMGINMGFFGSGINTMQPKAAAGIKRVPFDNYPALLHKGEAVLPSGEAGEYRRQGNMDGRAANNISLNISVNGGSMDENRLASILVNKLQEVALNMA